MKIAVVGMGVSGSYLSNQLSGDHQVTCFERYPKKKYQCVCAWGTSKHYISKYAENCDLNFEEYILHEGDRLLVSIGGTEIETPLCGLVTFEKHRFLLDMQRRQKIKFSSFIRSEEDLKGHDLIIDATGLRTLLPRIQKHEVMIPCVQYTVKYQDPPFDDFYVEILENMSGYLWYFPLGDGCAHVGAGDLNHGHQALLQRFLNRYGGEKEDVGGKPVRICPPKYCQPFQLGKVVGVGESIGTVFPLLGEGIIPTLQCSELLLNHLDDLDKYCSEVLRQFSFYGTAYNFLEPLLRGEIGLLDQTGLLIAVLMHMLANETRYGFKMGLTGLSIEPLSFIKQMINLTSMLRI